jgi:hypothetical protein
MPTTINIDDIKRIVREALREELVPLHGIVNGLVAPMAGIGDFGSVLPTDVEDEVIVWGYLPGEVGSIVTRVKIADWSVVKILWSWTISGVDLGFPDYNISQDRVVVPSFDDGRIFELDAKTGQLLNTVNLGTDSRFRMWAVKVIQENPRIVIAPHRDFHYVGLVNLDTGAETVLFGTKGTSGDDLTHLRAPMDVEYFLGSGSTIRYYLIADSWNNRVLKVDASTLSVTNMYLISGIGNITAYRHPVTEAFNSRRGHPENFNCMYSRAAATRYWSHGNSIPQGWLSVLNEARPHAFLPFMGGDQFVWVSPHEGWIAYGEKAFLLDLRYFKEPPRLQVSFPLVSNYSLAAGASYPPSGDQYATVLNGLFLDEIALEIYSSQSATAYIDVPEKRFGGFEVATNFSWVEYDSFPLTGGKVTSYLMTQPPSIFRVRVVMGSASGVISIYVKEVIK